MLEFQLNLAKICAVIQSKNTTVVLRHTEFRYDVSRLNKCIPTLIYITDV